MERVLQDSEIVELYLARDEDAIAQTARKYGVRLRGIAAQITEDARDAEECENDTYLEAWTRIPRAAGRGPRTGAREDDHVWPGYNAVTLAVVDDALAARALDALRAFREAHPKAGLFAWTVPVDAAL